MNDIESRLADAMAARAREVEPQDEDDALNRISERVNMNRRRGLTVLGIAAGLMIVVGAVALLNRDDDKGQQVNFATDSSGGTPTTASPPASVIPVDSTVGIWPFASDTARTFKTPEEAAKSFAVDYLGMTHARVGNTTGNDVEIFPNDRGSARTVVHVAELSNHNFVVVGADADQIVVDTPKPGDPLSPTLTISGRSVAFEAQIGIQLRPFGLPTPTVEDFTMGGSTDMQPFRKQLTVPKTDQAHVLILFEGDASGEQTFTKATVILLTPAGDPRPTEFVGLTTTGDLMRLDFSGHVQQTLATGAVEYAFAPTTGLVAYTHAVGGCGIDFVRFDGSPGPARIENAIAPVFAPGGDKLAFTVCGDRHVAVRTLATGEQIDGVPDFVPTLPSQTGILATLRGRFGTVAFYNGRSISSYNPADGKVVELVQPAAEPRSLDADESGRHLLWVDTDHNVWTWSGGEPTKVGSGFTSAAW
ncbi:MAG: hypothetical protein QOI95_587 [Acidimicrobiaceae bacterium]|jgi:hypothetical protein